jgi:hypothetical protein
MYHKLGKFNISFHSQGNEEGKENVEDELLRGNSNSKGINNVSTGQTPHIDRSDSDI